MPRRTSSGHRPFARPDRVGRPVPRLPLRGPHGRHRPGGARAPHLEHGPEDHRRLRDAREQGARADRGARPLRAAVRPDRGRRASELRRPRARQAPRRRRPRPSRLPGHAGADLVGAPLSGSHADGAAPARPRRRAHARVLRPRPRDVPAARARPARRGARRNVSLRLQRRERDRGRSLPRGAAVVPRDHRRGRRGAGRSRRRTRARPRRAGRGRWEARRLAERGMSVR